MSQSAGCPVEKRSCSNYAAGERPPTARELPPSAATGTWARMFRSDRRRRSCFWYVRGQRLAGEQRRRWESSGAGRRPVAFLWTCSLHGSLSIGCSACLAASGCGVWQAVCGCG
eukprot:3588674-Prymnesium_polylepis.2